MCFSKLLILYLSNYGGTANDNMIFELLIKWGVNLNKSLSHEGTSFTPIFAAMFNLFGKAEVLISMLLKAGLLFSCSVM